LKKLSMWRAKHRKVANVADAETRTSINVDYPYVGFEKRCTSSYM